MGTKTIGTKGTNTFCAHSHCKARRHQRHSPTIGMSTIRPSDRSCIAYSCRATLSFFQELRLRRTTKFLARRETVAMTSGSSWWAAAILRGGSTCFLKTRFAILHVSTKASTQLTVFCCTSNGVSYKTILQVPQTSTLCRI